MKTKLEVPVPGGGDNVGTCDLMRALDADPRFRRDSALGAIFHPRKASYREISPTGSLHVLIDGDRISAHVDDVSPLVVRADGSAGYHWGRVLAHNVLVMIADVGRRARGLAGSQRCNLDCRVEWVEDDEDGVRPEVGCA